MRSEERVERLEVERVISLCLEGIRITNMLDVGTGSGLFAEGFSKRKIHIYGIDANEDMPPAARSFVPEGNFAQATAEELPFVDGAFDLTFYGLVLHEADETLRVLQSAWRVTRKRTCILEWPYREQSFGPPLNDRLSREKLEEMFHEAGYRRWKCKELKNTVLYRLSG